MEMIPAPREHEHQAGFVPPMVNISSSFASLPFKNNNNNSNEEMNYSDDDEDYDEDESDDSSIHSQSCWNQRNTNTLPVTNNTNAAKGKTRGVSGRKPTKNDKVNKLLIRLIFCVKCN